MIDGKDNAGTQRCWLDAALANVGDAVIATDAECRIECLNPAAAAFLGVEAGLARGKSIDDFLHLVDAETGLAIANPLQESMLSRRSVLLDGGVALRLPDKPLRLVEIKATPVQSGNGTVLGGVMLLRGTRSAEGETVMRKADRRAGERRQALERVASALRDNADRVIGMLGVATDITERNRAQRELEYLLVTEHRLRGEAERASRAKDEFLALVSHELRSPLNALKGWSHVLSSASCSDPLLVMRGTQAIKRNVAHQARLIDDLLDTSRIVSGKLEIERQPVNLVEVVHAAIDLSRESAQAKHIDLRITAEQLVLTVVGDFGRLQQVVINLLSNAIKFTPEKGRVDIALQHRTNLIRLSVSDTGIGIEPDFLPNVFNRFSQADSSTIRRYCGLGIGLALVRYLVELHGGAVSAASPGIGQGATFTVELPAHRGSETRTPEETERRLPPGDALRGLRVLLVDDDPDAREVIQIALTHAGGEIWAFESGRELLAALGNHGLPAMPTILVLDIAMPDRNGFDLLAGIRALDGLPFIPAIAVTALTHLEGREFALGGFQDSIGKPVDIDRLIETIVTVAGRRGNGYLPEAARIE